MILVHIKLVIAILYKTAVLAFAYFVFALFIVHGFLQWIKWVLGFFVVVFG